MFDFINYSERSKHYDTSNKLFAGKIKNGTGGVSIKEVARLKPEAYLLVGGGYKKVVRLRKTKSINKNFASKLRHSEYKDVLVSNKCLRQSMKRTQSKSHRILTHEIIKSQINHVLIIKCIS